MFTWPKKGATTREGGFNPVVLFGKFMPKTVKGIDQGDSVMGETERAKIQFFCSTSLVVLCSCFIYGSFFSLVGENSLINQRSFFLSKCLSGFYSLKLVPYCLGLVLLSLPLFSHCIASPYWIPLLSKHCHRTTLCDAVLLCNFTPNNIHILSECDKVIIIKWQMPWEIWKLGCYSFLYVIFCNWKCSD